MMQPEIYDLHPLFEDVQLNHVFADGKTFVDCLPQQSPELICQDYEQQKQQPGFNLKRFVLSHFILPVPHSTNYRSDQARSVEENIEKLWPVLTRQPEAKAGSIIPLPYSYIVPGGRFGEIYYWDSYFTMLGLKVSGKTDMIENMINNFSFLIDSFGYIPNGNRSYFIGRSQPPFYSLMVQLLAGIKGKEVLQVYLPQLLKEYDCWMKDAHALNASKQSIHHSVRMPGGEILNRFWDEHNTPRPESYAADIHLSEQSVQDPKILFRHLRAGAESGWDYSCRWFKNIDDFSTIHTTDIVPIDLNGLIYHLEKTIAEAYEQNGEDERATHFNKLAEKRRKAVNDYCWNEQAGFYVDYDWKEGVQKECLTLAGITPLFFNMCSSEQADKAARVIKEKFLNEGGLVNTLKITGQQWDAPNGWAPLHWMAIIGLENYGHHELASVVAKRWIKLNRDVFRRTGKLMEKYNVVDTHLEAGGGEYEGQDGFGWTNGVLLALIEIYEKGRKRGD